jgi:hypothetical protein
LATAFFTADFLAAGFFLAATFLAAGFFFAAAFFFATAMMTTSIASIEVRKLIRAVETRLAAFPWM